MSNTSARQKKSYKSAEQEILRKVYQAANHALISQGKAEDYTILDEEVRKLDKEMRQRFFQNTNKLLEGYCRMVNCIKSLPEVIANHHGFYEWEEDIDKLVDVVKSDCNTRCDSKSVLQRLHMDKQMIDQVHHAIKLLELVPGRRGLTGKEMAEYIKIAYIYEDQNDKDANREPWLKNNESRSGYFKRLQAAKKEFSDLLWGTLDPEFQTAYLIMLEMPEKQ